MCKRLELGKLVATQGVSEHMAEDPIFSQFVFSSLERYKANDWGDLDEEDIEVNNYALTHGERVLASYTSGNEKIWIITEADRSYTTVLFPDEY